MPGNEEKFVIRMQGGGYFKEVNSVYSLVTTRDIAEAMQFNDRFEALRTMWFGTVFAHAAIMPYQPGPTNDSCDEHLREM